MREGVFQSPPPTDTTVFLEIYCCLPLTQIQDQNVSRKRKKWKINRITRGLIDGVENP